MKYKRGKGLPVRKQLKAFKNKSATGPKFSYRGGSISPIAVQTMDSDKDEIMTHTLLRLLGFRVQGR